jgi:hypothetical protein
MRAPRGLTRGLIASAAILGVLFFSLPLTLSGSLRHRLAAALGQRFGGSVEIQALRVSVFPRLRIAGDGVVIRRGNRPGLPPLISIRAFSGEAGLLGLLGSSLRIREVRLSGLEVNVPPGGVDMNGDANDAAASSRPDTTRPDATRPDTTDGTAKANGAAKPAKSPIIVDHVLSEDAVLRILRGDPGKKPREFAISRLTMEDTGAETPWAFTASLTNPTPPGKIEAHGTFGPWSAGSPSQTPLAAEYTFSDADLGVFKGIAGILHSSGKFAGVLERIDVNGKADVPDFALDSANHPMPLATTFHSIVDGTNGNTWLQPVDATFRQTTVHAEGGVIEGDNKEGRTITLDVTMDRARLEDVLFLAVKSDQPPMSGALKLRAKLEIPPGHVSALQKLILKGTFTIDDARFAGDGIQTKVNEMSEKAKKGDDPGPAREALSDFNGRFAMSGGVIRFSAINFSMPGAHVSLAGSYTAAGQAMDFKGTVRIDAKLSEMTTGMKSMFLRVIEPVFRRRGATVIPITIGGTVKEPKVGLDMVRAFTPK